MKRRRFLLLYLAAWMPAAALYSLLLYTQSNNRSVAGAIVGGIESALIAGLLGLGVWRITSMLAERTSSTGLLVAWHVPIAFLYAIVWAVLNAISIALSAPTGVLQTYIATAIGWQIAIGLFVYGTIAAIAHATAVSDRLRREREAAQRAEALRVRAELSAVRAQINPHFLFNTLHSITALVRSDPAAVEDALERLALLLRRVMDVSGNGTDTIALDDEWSIVLDQLELERLRYGERMRVTAKIETDALDCDIPIFALQPLVENAVRHAVAVTSSECTIRVAASVKDDVLHLEVSDDGPGATDDALRHANGLGLRSVRERLQLLHGEDATMRVETASGCGFRVCIDLPAVSALGVRTVRQRRPFAFLK